MRRLSATDRPTAAGIAAHLDKGDDPFGHRRSFAHSCGHDTIEPGDDHQLTTINEREHGCRVHDVEVGAGPSAELFGARRHRHPFHPSNQAAAPCTVTGYPGATLLNATGTQVGPDAARHPSPVTVVTLAPGAKAQFHELDPQAACPDAPRAAQIRIFPPNQTASLTRPVQEFVCHPAVTAVDPFNPNEATYVN